MNYFEYNGISSLDLGLRIESKNVFSAPKYEVKFQSIPGRDGDLILPNGRFPNVQITYSVFLPAKTKEQLADKLAAVKAWLFYQPDRYHELRDSYDTTGFRKAVINTQLDIEDQLNKIGVFTVSFSCLPFRTKAKKLSRLLRPRTRSPILRSFSQNRTSGSMGTVKAESPLTVQASIRIGISRISTDTSNLIVSR